jgi:hypothetical protein
MAGVKKVGGLVKRPTVTVYRNRYGVSTGPRQPIVDSRQDMDVMRRSAHQEMQWQKKPYTLVLAEVTHPGTPTYYAVCSYGLWIARERSGVIADMVSIEIYETLGGESHGNTKKKARKAS